MKKFFKWLLIIIAILACVGLLIHFANRFFGFGSSVINKISETISDGVSVNVTPANYIKKEMDIDDFDKLSIDTTSVSVRIETGDEYCLKYCIRDDRVIEVDQDGDTLSISTPSHINLFWGSTWLDTEEEYINVTVPRRTSVKELDINLSSGSFKCTDVCVTGKIQSSSGSVSVLGTNSDSLKIDTTSGAMLISDSKLNSLECDSSSGSCSIENCQIEKLSTTKSSGSGSYTNVTADDWHCKSTSGSIKFDSCTIGTLSGESSSGSIKAKDVQLDNLDFEMTSGSASFELTGNEADYDYDLECTTGNIKLNGRTQDDSFSTSYGKSKNIKLHSTSGSINISFD